MHAIFFGGLNAIFFLCVKTK